MCAFGTNNSVHYFEKLHDSFPPGKFLAFGFVLLADYNQLQPEKKGLNLIYVKVYVEKSRFRHCIKHETEILYHYLQLLPFLKMFDLLHQAGWYEICLSMREYYKHSGYRLTGLAPGNWTFKIRPVSLGGEGIDTREKYFFIPPPPGKLKFFFQELPIPIIKLLLFLNRSFHYYLLLKS